jgi:hypothetical protein
MKCPPTLRHFIFSCEIPIFVQFGPNVHKKQKISQDGYGIRSFPLHDLNQTIVYVRFYIGDATFRSHLLAHEEGFVQKKFGLYGRLFVGVMCLLVVIMSHLFWLGSAWHTKAMEFLFVKFLPTVLFPFLVAKPRETSKRHFWNYMTLVPTFHATTAFFLLILFFWVDVHRQVNVRATHPPYKVQPKDHILIVPFPFLALRPPPSKPCVSCKMLFSSDEHKPDGHW